MHSLQHGLHDGWWYDYGSHGAKSVQRVCGWVWRYEFRWHKRLHSMRRRVLQSVREQCRVHAMHNGAHDDRWYDDGSYGVE